jgi:pyruvate dehydrogenase E1 component alpha subunit
MSQGKTAKPSKPAPPKMPPKIRAGMGDVVSEQIAVYSDADVARATGLLSILGPDGKADAARVPRAEPATWLALYRGMLRVRMLDERLMALQRQGRIGFYADGRGQEATTVAPVAALEADDWIVPSHREAGAALYRGLSLRSYVAQVLGNGNDIGKGRRDPAHPATPRALRVLPASGCSATQLPQAAGIGWAARIKGDKIVVLAYLGEGATSAEDFHTGINFAAVYRAPVVFVCANNGWATSTPAARQSASPTFAIKALAYGLPGVRVDGNDVFAVTAATREAVERARRGDGPTLIEAVTYRLSAHSSSDEPERYRDAGEVESRTAEEPLLRFGAWLRNARLLDDARERALVAELDAEIRDAIAAEEKQPPLARRSLIEDVTVQPSAALEEQLADLERVRAATP